MRTFKRTTGFLAIVACLLAAGCGSDDEGADIPRASATAFQGQLDSIQDRFEFGGAACADITGGDDPNTQAVQRTLDDLPSDVDQDVRDALAQGFDRLFELVDEQCQPSETKTETQTVTEPPPTETQTETTPPETTETTPPPTETTEPPPTDTGQPTPPGQGGDGTGGQGGSGGTGQGGDGSGDLGGTSGGALVPGDEG